MILLMANLIICVALFVSPILFEKYCPNLYAWLFYSSSPLLKPILLTPAIELTNFYSFNSDTFNICGIINELDELRVMFLPLAGEDLDLFFSLRNLESPSFKS